MHNKGGYLLLLKWKGYVWEIPRTGRPGSCPFEPYHGLGVAFRRLLFAGRAGFQREIRAGGVMGITYPCSMRRWHLGGGGNGRFVLVQSLFSEN